MKKLILLVCCVLFFVSSARANTEPYSVNDINPKSIGLYQAENVIKIYKEPNENSVLESEVSWNEAGICTSISASDIFVAFYPKRNLAFLTVMDESEDMEWLQILYKKNQLGWIKIQDPYKYSNWRNFTNDYGRKYGLKYLKGTSQNLKILYGSPDENSKPISEITLPKAIKLTSVSGNWALVIVYDIDNTQKIGWLKWRNTDGQIFLFPTVH